MTKAVRYFSRLGNTKTIAEAIVDGAGVKAVSITDEPELKEQVDIWERNMDCGLGELKGSPVFCFV